MKYNFSFFFYTVAKKKKQERKKKVKDIETFNKSMLKRAKYVDEEDLKRRRKNLG